MQTRCLSLLLLLFVLCFCTGAIAADIPVMDDDGDLNELLVEALLSPGEFADRRFEHVSEGDEALYCLDASLSAREPFAQVYPERIPWPGIGGVSVRVENVKRRLLPAGPHVNDELLDNGFAIRWQFEPVGLRFDSPPLFLLSATSAEVFSTTTGTVLFKWEKPKPEPVCTEKPIDGHPRCRIRGVSLEVRHVAVNPTGSLAALAISGVKPRLEMYSVEAEPHLMWQLLFPVDSGGVIEAAFSADGNYVAALVGNGTIHRMDISGGRHLFIPSSGRTSRVVPPGTGVLVAAANGEITLWRLNDGTIDWRLPPRGKGPIDRMAVSGNGGRIATLNYDGTKNVVRVWDTAKRQVMTQIDVSDDRIADMAFNTDGSLLYITHEVDGLLVSKLTKGAGFYSLGPQARECRGAIAWLGARNHLACSMEGGIAEFDVEGKRVAFLQTGIAAQNARIAMSPAGNRTVAVADGQMFTW